MAEKKTKEAFIITNFNDAGTEQSFAARSIVPIEEGVFENYRAAGLVRAATAAEVKAARQQTAE